MNRAAVSVAAILALTLAGCGGSVLWGHTQTVYVSETADFEMCVRAALRDLGLAVDPQFTSDGDIFVVLPPRTSNDRLTLSIQKRAGAHIEIMFVAQSKPDDDQKFVTPLLASMTIAIVSECKAK